MTDPTRPSDRDRLIALAAEGQDIPYDALFDQAAVITGLPRDSAVLTGAMAALCDAVAERDELDDLPGDMFVTEKVSLDQRIAAALARLGVAS